jgi:M6 family metalloprotease-like protein
MSRRLSLRTRAFVAALALVPAGLAGAFGESATAKPPPPFKRGPELFGDLFPANPARQLLKQPDGTTFGASLTNGEIGGAFETEAGYTVVRGNDRVWRFATGRDTKGTLLPSTIAVRPGLKPTGIAPHAGRTRNVWDDGTGRDVRSQTFRALQIASRKAQDKARANGEPRVFRFPALMLATWFDEANGQTEPQFQDGTNTPGYFKNILDGFGGNPEGTLTEFYFEDSFGQFLVQVDVFGPFTSQRSREDACYYGGIGQSQDDGDLDLLDTQLGVGGGGAIGMALESIPQADPTVDFGPYDNDLDGEVDFTAIIHSGADMAVTGNPCNTWSHATTVNLAGPIIEGTLGLDQGSIMTGLQTSDVNASNQPVHVNRVFTMPEFASPTGPLTIGVATHEMSHALGEPDYYDTTGASQGNGDWDIMAGGSYLGNPAGSNPSLHNPTSRVFQGFLQPTIVHDTKKAVTLKPRNQLPFDGYTADAPDPNLLLVPTYEIAVGETDSRDHTWTENDVYGLALDPVTDKYVVEGFYIENVNRMWHTAPTYDDFSRGGYFDRKVHQSGLMVWHFDYWLRSNVYFNSNNAQSFSNRPQMDPMEFDRNDNTQELQLNMSRGNVGDLLSGAAAGISSGTRKVQPNLVVLTGEPQADIAYTGITQVNGPSNPFTVEANENNYRMTVTAVSKTTPGDCTLQLFYEGAPFSKVADSGSIGDPETIVVNRPKPGAWSAKVGDFAGCVDYEGTVTFSNGSDELPTKGAADTWSNWSGAPTGWAFTNVGPQFTDGIATSIDSNGTENITLDLMHYGGGDADAAPGFANGAPNERGGFGVVSAGRSNALSVPVFNHGGKATGPVTVEVRAGSAAGPVVATKSVSLGAYGRKDVAFAYQPAQEGWFDLYVTTSVGLDANTANNTQKATLWAGPANPRVLVVDDDGELNSEQATLGALAALGVPYAVVTEHPTAAELKKYQAVVWETGVERLQGQFDAGDRVALKAYLDGGGKVLIQSNRVASALGTAQTGNEDSVDFFKNYFGGTYGGPDDTVSREGMSQVKGTGHLYGTSFAGEIVPFAARQFIETIVPAAAEDVFGTASPELSVNGVAEGHFLGVSVDGNTAHKSFKTIVLGYNFTQHKTADTSVGILRGALAHFGVPLGTYTVSTAEPIVYHGPVRDQVAGRATPITATVLGGKAGAPVTLNYRRHNLGGFHVQKMTGGDEPGTFNGELPTFAATPDGIDYYLKAGTASTYAPRGAGLGRLTFGVGVQLPEVADPLAILPGGLVPVPEKPPVVVKPPVVKPPALPATGLPAVLSVAALVLLGTALVVRRRTRAE